MTDDFEHTYELYSSSCTASRLSASTRFRLEQDRGWLLFGERVDLNFGLSDKLLANGVLDEVGYDDVKASQSTIIGYQKLSQYRELANRRSTYMEVNYHFVTALQFTMQQHLLNYAWNSGVYNSKFGGDWPITDRQRTALNVNQEILLELMEMSPQLIEELYSRNVLTKRHKDFICGPLAEIKKTETFLDILRRRSFRDYQETIKCFRATNQTHIAEILEGGAVIRILCTLKGSNCGHAMNRYSMETLVQRFPEELKKRQLDDEDEKLQLIKIELIGVKFDNAIVLYFKCKTNDHLKKLKKIYDNRELNAIVESDCRKLFSRDDHPYTAMLQWSHEDSIRFETYMLHRPFSDTCIDKLPMEVLEIILTKAYALHFYSVQPRPRDKDLFPLLSSISINWHTTISRRGFKTSLNRRLYPYFLSVRKRQMIIRSNREYLVEHLEPSSNLIRRLERIGCLTIEEANYIESLQRSTAKNHELLNVARTMSFMKHFTFVESLQFCGQLKVANVLEKGGVVFKTMATCDGVSINSEFINQLNEKIPETDREYGELKPYTNSFRIAIPEELEMLEVQPLKRRKGKTYIVIWVWCKAQNSSRQLRKLAQSDRLIQLLDILMTFIWSKSTEHLQYLIQIWPYGTYTLQFLKTLNLKTVEFQRAVVVRQLSVNFCGKFNLPLYSRAFTSLDDNIYVLTVDAILVLQYVAPYACQFKTVFPPSQAMVVYPDNRDEPVWFIEACHQTKCIYVVRSHDRRVWKFTTPEYNLEVWMHYLATLCSLSVTSNGNILILKYERQVGLPYDAYCLEMYTEDAVLVYNVNLDMPPLVYRPEFCSVLEMSPGNFAIKYQNTLVVKSVDFGTMTTTDQNRIQYPYIERKPYYGHITSIALYSLNRLIVVLDNKLTILDSRLNAENILNSSIGDVETLHCRKDKRQLMAYSSGMNKTVQIYTLQYEGEDLADDLALTNL